MQIKKISLKLLRFFRALKVPKHTKLIIISAIVGIFVGFVSVGFKYLMEYVQHLAFNVEGEKILSELKRLPWYVKLLAPAIGGLIVGLILNFIFQEAKGGGVEEVMSSVATKRGAISFKTVIGKLIASSITIGTGGSAGREGPIVQIGGGIGSSIARWLNLNEEHVKTLVGAGVSAGIAAAFNAPIAGAFFALEIILGDFALNTFSTIIISSVSATVVSRFFFGNQPPFELHYFLNHTYEFGYYIILGVVAGLVCVLFIKSLFFSEHFFSKLKIPVYLKPALGGLLVGIIALQVPEVMGVGYDTIENILKESHKHTIFSYFWLSLFVILIGKIIATASTLGSGGSGGTIVPSLYLGSMVGGILGIIFQQISPGQLNSGAYALVGMSAIIAGTTQAPIMAIMLFFEATGNYQIILPVMIVSIISSLITKYFISGSMYTIKLKSQGINLYEGIEKTVMSTIKASEIMKKNLYTFHVNTSFKKILESFLNVNHQEAFVINDNSQLVGMISLAHMKTIIQDEDVQDYLIAGDLMIDSPPFAFPESNLSYCTELLAQEDVDIIPIVTTEDDKKLTGYITRKDILSIYNLEVMKKNLSGFKFVSKIGEGEQKKYLDLASNYRIESIHVPQDFINKNLRTLDTRKNYNITVIAVQKSNSNSHEIPLPDMKFSKDDIIVIVGETKDIDYFLEMS